MTTFAQAMPNMLRHEGKWEGTYRHIARDGTLVDQHEMTTLCEFPAGGEFAYVQHNHLRWTDGRELKRSFGGAFRDGLLRWDTDRFAGYGWETREGVVMLKLDRKDEPGVHFIEMITLGSDNRTRARTWQWFRNGVPFRRTLCDEWRVT
ncbi:MAG TPA: hypothetical protein VEZ41_14385 [Allosphingosinicella sp.]|nr:hypothetical protein [Allosphingosinicella sp.]